MDDFPVEDMPDIAQAARAVSQEAIDSGVWVCGSDQEVWELGYDPKIETTPVREG